MTTWRAAAEKDRSQGEEAARHRGGRFGTQAEIDNQEVGLGRTAQPASGGPRNLTPSSVRQLQRKVGNQAVGALMAQRPATDALVRPPTDALVSLPLRDMVHPVVTSMERPDVGFRVPSFAALKAAYTDKDLKIPEKVIQDRVAQLLNRMKAEKPSRLKSADPVPTIIAKIFPAPGKIDETEFNNALDVSERKIIYASVIEADTQVKAADSAKLITAMKDAATLIRKVAGDAAGLKQVFGGQDAKAKANYGKAAGALDDAVKDLGKHVTTDYNLDDPEVGLGGYALFGEQKMHLLLRIAQVNDANDTKATVIHEASHLADSSVDDHVYYADDGFFELDDATKAGNAAHYEELPRRDLKTSKFDGKTFTPGVKPGGGAVTREDKIKAATANYLRKSWDAGVDAHTMIRGVRRQYLAGNSKPFKDNKALILEISKLMDLTVHEQASAKAIVTTLDVTLSESVSRGVRIVRFLAKSVPFPAIGAMTDDQVRDKIVAAAVTSYGELLKNPARDKALLAWLEAHYRSLPDVR